VTSRPQPEFQTSGSRSHFDSWRIVLAFPAKDEVTILKIAPHHASTGPVQRALDVR